MIYTKTGDLGQTSLFGGKRVIKSSLPIEAYGEIDELNSFIGLTLEGIDQISIKNFLKAVQTDLLTIGAYLGGYPQEKLNLELRVSEIEKVIDEIDKKLPHITHFILPGGGRIGALLHVCRAIARRAERTVVGFFQDSSSQNISEARKRKIIMYLNRVSDFLFVLARFANKEEKVTEEIWSGDLV